MTAEEAGVVLDALVAAFPQRIMSEDTVRIYARFLVDIELDVALGAVAQWIARCRTFPMIADLRELCDPSPPPDADRAFGEVMKAVGRFGSYMTPTFSHVAITQAVESITWREVCMSEHMPSLRAHFGKAYDAAKKRTADPAHAQLVDGIKRDVLALVGAARKELKA